MFCVNVLVGLFLLSGGSPSLSGQSRASAQPSGPAATGPQSRAPAQILADAIQFHQAGDFERAVRGYEAFLAAGPSRKGEVLARSNLGAALAHLGRYEDAIEQYQRALRVMPDSAEVSEVRFNLAVAYYKSGRVPDAAQELSALLKGHSTTITAEDARAILLLADCHLRMGENRKVIELLSPLEPTHREDRTFDYLLGTALIRDNQSERGQVIIDRILRDGDSAEARLMMGTAKFKVGDIPGAIDELRRAVAINPRLLSAHSFLGRALLSAGDRYRATEAFRQELEIDLNDFESNLYLGALAREDQNYEEARRYLRRALEVRPGDSGARYQIGSLDLAAGKIEDAERELEQVVKDAPNFVEAHVSLATVYYREKRKQDGDRERAIVEKLNAEVEAHEALPQPKPATAGGEGSSPTPPKPQ
jgi:tetratricopeptide (TPR) repeat protein